MSRRPKEQAWTRDEIQKVAEEGYIYGYPLVLMDFMRRIHTAVPFATADGAPLNQFCHSRFLPGPGVKPAFRPHADSLRSTAWLDLSSQPVILTIPRTDRYYVLSLFSAWGDLFDSISPRTNGIGENRVAFAGPNSRARLPDGIKRIVTPSERIWINGRIQAADVEDLESVHSVQDAFRLTPLDEWGEAVSAHTSPFRPGVDRRRTPHEQVEDLPASAFYTRLSALMRKNHPPPCDAPIVRRLAQIGFVPFEDFSFETLAPNTTHAMYAAVPAAKLTIARAADAAAMKVNNWAIRAHPHRSEMNHLNRAAASRNMFWSSFAEDVVAFQATQDKTGEALRGANDYVIQFDQQYVPPVNAFWSITVYDSRQLLPANTLHRHFIGDRNNLRLNPDNSLSIYIQHTWPGTTKDSNWLPAPRDLFEVVLQLYWPKSGVLNGIWRPPALTRVR